MRVSEGAGFPRLLEEAALEFLEVLRKTIHEGLRAEFFGSCPWYTLLEYANE